MIASSPTQPSLLTYLISPMRGHRLTHQSDHFFIQEELGELWVDEPAFGHQPALLADRPETPDPGQYDSTHNPSGEGDDNDEDTASQLGSDPGGSTSDETDISVWSNLSSTAECHWHRNCTLWGERTRARQEFQHPRNQCISFPLFR